MRLIYWNIRAGGGVRAAQIAAQLKRWRPDVVGLSEFRGTPASQSLAAALAEQGLRHQLAATDPTHPPRNAVFLASRNPLRRIALKRAPLEPCRWLVATTTAGPGPIRQNNSVNGSKPSSRLPGGTANRQNDVRKLTVGVMHAPNFVTGRKQDFFSAVLATSAGWRGGPVVLGGDTNTGVPPLDGPPEVFHDWEVEWIHRLRDNGWYDAFREAHPRTAAPTWYSPNRQTGYRLDQVFVNAPLRGAVRSVRYSWGRARPPTARRDALSDHAALILDINLPF